VSAAIVAFAGAIGSGKSTISTALAKELGWARTSFGDYVREEAARRELDPTSRTVLQILGEQLIAEGWEPFCRAVLNRVSWRPGQALIIDGVRHVKALETLRRLVAPLPIRLIYLALDDGSRAARIHERTPRQEPAAGSPEQHPTEHEVATRLSPLADLQVNTSRDVHASLDLIISHLALHEW